jgi:RNA-directed DNA polymerase
MPMLPFDANLASLLTRTPKSEGTKTHPIGGPSCEEKVLQRAVLTGLEVAREQGFLACSYWFRLG